LTDRLLSRSFSSMNALATVLSKTREAKGLSQRALADKAKIHFTTVQRAEAGDKASLDTLRALATALDLDLNVLVNIAP
jgi:transcriptional regulator with XRE-family HTH domain